MAILGLCGLIGSGKNTVAKILVDDYGYHKFTFADALKDAVADIFLWPRNLLEGDTNTSREFREKIDPWWSAKFGYDVTPRLMLQKMGTEACRNNISENIWIVALEKRIQGYRNVVISDVRFVNELSFVRGLGGKIWNVKRGPYPDWWEYAKLYNNSPTTAMGSTPEHVYGIHPSEYSLAGQKFDYEILNDGTFEDLKKSVDISLTLLEKNDTIFHHPV